MRARTYSGTHEVTLSGGEVVQREVPAIIEPELQRRAIARLAENKRFSGGKKGHNYLLRSLIECAECGIAYVDTGAYSPKTNKRYHYYVCSNRKARHYDARTEGLCCPNVGAKWLEELVWADVRRFLENPREVLERAREQMESDGAAAELEERHADLQKRLAAKSAEGWLLTLRERIAEVEEDTGEASQKRRELVRLLVERITVGSGEDGATQVQITYRFGPPPTQEADGFSHGELVSVQDLSTKRSKRRVVYYPT